MQIYNFLAKPIFYLQNLISRREFGIDGQLKLKLL